MAEIIEFGKKAQDLKVVRESGLKEKKIEALRRIFQCTRCMIKCAKCGTQIESKGDPQQKFAAPYSLCANCNEEYQDYRERANGDQTTPKYYWHNDAWMKVWESWLDHQKWVDQYRQSKEFLQLLREVEELLK